jgi:hypothetical protein
MLYPDGAHATLGHATSELEYLRAAHRPCRSSTRLRAWCPTCLGADYAAFECRWPLDRLGTLQSKNRRGKMNNNAHIEWFCHTMRAAELYGKTFASDEQLCQARAATSCSTTDSACTLGCAVSRWPSSNSSSAVSSVFVRAASNADIPVLAAFLSARWGSIVVSRGAVHRLESLPAVVAEQGGAFAGCLTYRRDGPHSLEVVTIDAVNPRQGAGRALMHAIRRRQSGSGWSPRTTTWLHRRSTAVWE